MEYGANHESRYANQGQRVYSGNALRAISFPLGGMGTGTVGLQGRGSLGDWDIFLHAGHGRALPFTFFALWFHAEGGEPGARVLERQFLPPAGAARSLQPNSSDSLPRFKDSRFLGEYPFAWVDLADPAVPLVLRLRGWNPLIPMNDADSSLPAALLDWHVVNPTATRVRVSIAFCALNAVGWDGMAHVSGNSSNLFGGNSAEPVNDTATGIAGLRLSNPSVPPDDPRHGSVAIAATWPDVSRRCQWVRGAMDGGLQDFWDDFRQGGRLGERGHAGQGPDGATDVTTLTAHFDLEPGASADVPFTLCWSFPHRRSAEADGPQGEGAAQAHYTAPPSPDAWAVTRYVAENRTRLEDETRAFHEAVYDSTIPSVILDAATSSIAALRAASSRLGRPKEWWHDFFSTREGDASTTGVYRAAAGHIHAGALDEALRLVEEARAFHDGTERNPWDGLENGDGDARVASGWPLIAAWAGFQYSAPEAAIGFAPVVGGDFRCFLAGGAGWGVYERRGARQSLRLLYGELVVARWNGARGTMTKNGAPLPASQAGGALFPALPVTLLKGDVLEAGCIGAELSDS